jgi:hypothetical protein
MANETIRQDLPKTDKTVEPDNLLKDQDLDKAVGGLHVRKAGGDPKDYFSEIGSATSGAGAGKVSSSD